MIKTCIYRIDSSDSIVEIDEDNWDDFAKENGAAALVRKNVLGKKLWDFIADPAVQHIYKLLHERIRHKIVATAFPFRCDSPNKRRFMQMNIRRCGAGSIEFRSAIVREELRPYARVLDSASSRSAEIITICSFCKKVRLLGWVEVEEAFRVLNPFDSAPVPAISHGVCEACYEMVLNQLSYD
jgi:hypothetical protein